MVTTLLAYFTSSEHQSHEVIGIDYCPPDFIVGIMHFLMLKGRRGPGIRRERVIERGRSLPHSCF